MAKDIYLVTDAALVFRTTGKTNAQHQQLEHEARGETSYVVQGDDVSALPTKLLVALYNAASDKPITKFSSREVAERRMEGVLDYLAKPLVVVKTPPAKEPKAPKGHTEARVVGISDEEVDTVIALRGDGKTWEELIKIMDKPRNFILRVRKLLKLRDPGLVMQLGPGSPMYGKASGRKTSTAERRRREQETVTHEAF